MPMITALIPNGPNKYTVKVRADNPGGGGELLVAEIAKGLWKADVGQLLGEGGPVSAQPGESIVATENGVRSEAWPVPVIAP